MTSDLPFRFATAALLLVGIGVSLRYRLRAQRAGGPVSRQAEGALFLPLRLAGAAFYLGLLAYVIQPRWLSWAQVALPRDLRLAALPLAITSLLWCAWTLKSLGLNVTDTVATRERHSLVTAGPYRWVRHPLYSGGLLFGLAITLIAANAFLASALILGFALLAWRTRIEEEHLAARFGQEYRLYAERTGRFLPGRKRLRPEARAGAG